MTGKCREREQGGRIPRIPLTGSEFVISYDTGWVALASSDPSCSRSGSVKTATPTSSWALHLPVLPSQEAADPRSFDGGGGGGHGPHGEQGGRLAEGILPLLEARESKEACSRSTSEIPRKVCLGSAIPQ